MDAVLAGSFLLTSNLEAALAKRVSHEVVADVTKPVMLAAEKIPFSRRSGVSQTVDDLGACRALAARPDARACLKPFTRYESLAILLVRNPTRTVSGSHVVPLRAKAPRRAPLVDCRALMRIYDSARLGNVANRTILRG